MLNVGGYDRTRSRCSRIPRTCSFAAFPNRIAEIRLHRAAASHSHVANDAFLPQASWPAPTALSNRLLARAFGAAFARAMHAHPTARATRVRLLPPLVILATASRLKSRRKDPRSSPMTPHGRIFPRHDTSVGATGTSALGLFRACRKSRSTLALRYTTRRIRGSMRHSNSQLRGYTFSNSAHHGTS